MTNVKSSVWFYVWFNANISILMKFVKGLPSTVLFGSCGRTLKGHLCPGWLFTSFHHYLKKWKVLCWSHATPFYPTQPLVQRAPEGKVSQQ